MSGGSSALQVRTYGSQGPQAVLLHGGPGAPGTMAPVARGLADSFRVLEPFQRRSGGAPLTVARHVADLHVLIETRCQEPTPPPALVGSSWGAMLALAYAAAHPGAVRAVALVGCGTFDRRARARFREVLQERLDQPTRRRLERLREEVPDPDRRLQATAQLILPAYSFDPITTDLEPERCDARGHEESWRDMVRLQEAGVYPDAFAAIEAPVVMLHGSHDPHPGPLVREGLAPHLPQLEYREWDRCGHFPWIEKAARETFFAELRAWLRRHLGGA